MRRSFSPEFKRAMARDLVSRNVVKLVEVPEGVGGRPSKSLTVVEAQSVLASAEGSALYAFIVVSLLTGGRTEEMQLLTGARTHLDGDSTVEPRLPPYLDAWRSVRTRGDTKTSKSRRSLALPTRCIEVLTNHRMEQERQIADMGSRWQENGLVFASAVGTELDASNVRRAFRDAIADTPGLDASQ